MKHDAVFHDSFLKWRANIFCAQTHSVIHHTLYLVVVVQMFFCLVFHWFSIQFSIQRKLGYAKTIDHRSLSGTEINNLPFGHHPCTWPWIIHSLSHFTSFPSPELWAKIIFGSINLSSTPHPSQTITDKHRWQLPLASLTPLLYAMYCSAQHLVVQPHGTHHQTSHIYTHTLPLTQTQIQLQSSFCSIPLKENGDARNPVTAKSE